jgi:nucleoside-diphosphate-sugar epimerase
LKTILLTGATGFLGSHFLELFLDNGYKVIILKRSSSNVWRITNKLNEVISYDLDQVDLEHVFIQNHINVVVHTATNYGRHKEKNSEVLKTNVLFALELLEMANKFNTDTFFNTDTLQYDYLNAYTLSKKQFLEWAKSICKTKNIRFINMKLEHMYGPKDDKTKFIPWFIDQLKSGVDEIKLTAGTQKRDFIYVKDVAYAYLFLIDKLSVLDKGFHEFEVGTGVAVELRHFIADIFKCYCERKLGVGATEINTKLNFGAIPMRDGEPKEISANIEKLSTLGWNVSYVDKVQNILKCLNS